MASGKIVEGRAAFMVIFKLAKHFSKVMELYLERHYIQKYFSFCISYLTI